MWEYINIAITYILIALAAAILIHFIWKLKIPGNFIGAFVVGLIGSVIGGISYQIFPDFFKRLTDINSVNVYTAFLFAFLLIWILAKLSSNK
ncbi:MAG: hypothetical protein JXR70_13050 [Spirochaetales bacterium]|nr:hypothetical protein [Spirochaetales bacterium]